MTYSTIQLLALTAAALVVAAAAAALTVDRLWTRARARRNRGAVAPLAVVGPESVLVVAGTGVHCTRPECGKPVDRLRVVNGSPYATLTPCGHIVKLRDLLPEAV